MGIRAPYLKENTLPISASRPFLSNPPPPSKVSLKESPLSHLNFLEQ